MYDKPTTLVVAAVLAVIGGFAALAAAFLFFDPSADNLLSTGVLLLISVLFFGLAGGISTKGQWTWNVTMFMIFLCATVVICAYLFEVLDIEISMILAAIALLTAALTATKRSEAWID